jgi:hypothetical protein
MEYLFALNLIAHGPVQRFRWFAHHPQSLTDLITRRNRCIKLSASRDAIQREFARCLAPSNKGLQVDPKQCDHHMSTIAHTIVIDSTKKEVTYLNRKIDRLGEAIEKLMRTELGL